MSSKEDYLDSLLNTVNAGTPSREAALNKLAGIQDEEKNTAPLNMEMDDTGEDMEFPELAKLFADDPVIGEDTSETQETRTAEVSSEESSSDAASVSQSEKSSIAEPAAALSAEEIPGEAVQTAEEVPAEAVQPAEEVSAEAIQPVEEVQAEPVLDENASEVPSKEEALQASVDDGIAALMQGVDDDSDLARISELLNGTVSDAETANPEPVADGDNELARQESAMRELAGLQSADTEDAKSDAVSDKEQKKAQKQEEKKKKKQEREALKEAKKAEKEKKKEEKRLAKEERKKKPGALKRLFTFLTESEDDLEETDKGAIAEKEQLGLSQENADILEDLGKQKKKDKKEKKKKEKAPKEKKPKVKKEKKAKPKKEKKVKPPAEPEKPLRPIGVRRIAVTLFFAATILGMICLFVFYIPGVMERQEGRQAFLDGDYQKAYELLETKKVKGGEADILKGATLCMEMERQVESYEVYHKMDGMELQQLDALIFGIEKYQRIQDEAQQYGVIESVRDSYIEILGILDTEYGVSEEQALALTQITDKVAYTKALKQILGIEEPAAAETEG